MDIDFLKKELGRRIKIFRCQNNLTQEGFCELVNIEQSNLSNIENGKAYPGFITLCNIIRYAQIDPNYLFGFLVKKSGKAKLIEDEIMESLLNIPDDTKKHLLHIIKSLSSK